MGYNMCLLFHLHLLLCTRGRFHQPIEIRSDRPHFQTKGLSLEQIDEMYQQVMPLKSHEYRRRLKESEAGRFGTEKAESFHDEKA